MQFCLEVTDKPKEETPEVYRFQMPLKSGETKTFTVKEERDISASVQLTTHFCSSTDTSPLS